MKFFSIISCYIFMLINSISANYGSGKAPIFHGMTYSPYSSSGCFDSQKIQSDLIQLANFTNSIRLYGCDCNQVDLVLNAITRLNLDLKLIIGIWTRDGQARFQNDLNQLLSACSNSNFRQYISHVLVGNEELHNGASLSTVLGNIQLVRSALHSAGFSDIPIGAAEVDGDWSSELAQACDVISANIQPYFAQLPSGNQYTIDQAVTDAVQRIQSLPSKCGSDKPIIISEIGWPTQGNPSVYGSASVPSQCTFLNQLKCVTQIPYFVMDSYDAMWKHNDLEQSFGVFTSGNNLKCPNVLSPSC